MGRIDNILSRLRAEGRSALMPFLTAGYPDLSSTEQVLRGIESHGVEIVELGVPFSDPIADGPVIAASMHEALAGGVRPGDVLDLVRRVRAETQLGLVLMVSDSIVERLGGASFIEDAASAGCDGLIVPDIDLDRVDELLPVADRLGLSFSLLVAPTTSDERLETILSRCRGFVYLLARTGLTGEQRELPDIAEAVQRIRSRTELPIAVGFGISTPQQVTAVTAEADAAIVGSAIVRRMTGSEQPAEAAIEYIQSLSTGLHAKA